jgi:hypothetical protein
VIKQEQVITVNPAKYVELDDSGKPPKAAMWTEEHVDAWKENRRERNLVALDLDTARERRDHSLIARLEAQLDNSTTPNGRLQSWSGHRSRPENSSTVSRTTGSTRSSI